MNRVRLVVAAKPHRDFPVLAVARDQVRLKVVLAQQLEDDARQVSPQVLLRLLIENPNVGRRQIDSAARISAGGRLCGFRNELQSGSGGGSVLRAGFGVFDIRVLHELQDLDIERQFGIGDHIAVLLFSSRVAGCENHVPTNDKFLVKVGRRLVGDDKLNLADVLCEVDRVTFFDRHLRFDL